MQFFGKDYFRELLEKVRSIRASERRICSRLPTSMRSVRSTTTAIRPQLASSTKWCRTVSTTPLLVRQLQRLSTPVQTIQKNTWACRHGRKFSREALVQVWDYAIDLKNFQEGSLERILIPILVVPAEKGSRCQTALKHFGDYVYEPLQVNTKRLAEAIEMVLGAVRYDVAPTQTDDQWAKSGYSPTPTIIEAAIALYEENTVEDITKHGGDIDKASVELCKIIDHCRANNRKAICFITGVPVPQGQVTDMLMLMVGHNRVRPLCALPFEKT